MITDPRFLTKLFEAEEREHNQEGWQTAHHHQRDHLVNNTSADPKDCLRFICRDSQAHRNRRLSVDAINSGAGRFKVCSVTGRFYTPVTNMKRELRRSLRFNGEPMVEVDLANSAAVAPRRPRLPRLDRPSSTSTTRSSAAPPDPMPRASNDSP